MGRKKKKKQKYLHSVYCKYLLPVAMMPSHQRKISIDFQEPALSSVEAKAKVFQGFGFPSTRRLVTGTQQHTAGFCGAGARPSARGIFWYSYSARTVFLHGSTTEGSVVRQVTRPLHRRIMVEISATAIDRPVVRHGCPAARCVPHTRLVHETPEIGRVVEVRSSGDLTIDFVWEVKHKTIDVFVPNRFFVGDKSCEKVIKLAE